MKVEEQYLTTKEMADFLRISLHSAYRYAADGVIPSVRLGPRTLRFRKTDLISIMENGNGGGMKEGKTAATG